MGNGKAFFWGGENGRPIVKYRDILRSPVRKRLNRSRCRLVCGLGDVYKRQTYTQVLNPKGSSIGAAVFAGLTSVTDRQTDRQTDRSRYSVGKNRPHLRTTYVVQPCGLIIHRTEAAESSRHCALPSPPAVTEWSHLLPVFCSIRLTPYNALSLGMEVSSAQATLDGDPSPPKGGTAAPTFRPMSTVAKRLDGSKCHLVERQASAQTTL